MSGSWKRNDWNGNRGSGLIMLTETFRNLVSYASSPSPVINPVGLAYDSLHSTILSVRCFPSAYDTSLLPYDC